MKRVMTFEEEDANQFRGSWTKFLAVRILELSLEFWKVVLHVSRYMLGEGHGILGHFSPTSVLTY